MKINITLGPNVCIKFTIPTVAYVAFAVVGVAAVTLMYGGLAGQPAKAKISLHEFEIQIGEQVNRVAKSDQILPTFQQRFEGFPLPPSPLPSIPGPMVEKPKQDQDRTKQAEVTKPVFGFYYRLRPKELGSPEEEVDLLVEKIACSWPSNFPPPCYYPQSERWKLPTYKYDEPL